MIMIRDDFIWIHTVYFIRNKDKVFRYFRQYLVDYRFTGVSSPVETVPTDDVAEFRALSDLCREQSIRQ